MQRLLRRLEKWGCRLAAVHLIDAHHCRYVYLDACVPVHKYIIHTHSSSYPIPPPPYPQHSDAGKFISAVLISLTTMVRLELPHVNVLSKIDLIESYGRLAFNLDFYTDLCELRNLLPYLEGRPMDVHKREEEEEQEEVEEQEEEGGVGMEVEEGSEEGGSARRTRRPKEKSGFMKRYHKLNEAMCELIEDFSLVAFQTLHIENPESVARVLAVVDKCNGYLLGVEERGISGREGEVALLESLSGLAFRAMPDADRVKDVQDRYMHGGLGVVVEEAEGEGK